MPVMDTKSFGRISYAQGSEIEFPNGLPGFDERRVFVALHFDETAPLVFLQSAEDPGLCFITLPVLSVDPQYRLEISGEDLSLLGLPTAVQPRIGKEVLCLAVLSIRKEGPTANLLAPVVINIQNRKAVQAVATESEYSHQHELVPAEAPVCS